MPLPKVPQMAPPLSNTPNPIKSHHRFGKNPIWGNLTMIVPLEWQRQGGPPDKMPMSNEPWSQPQKTCGVPLHRFSSNSGLHRLKSGLPSHSVPVFFVFFHTGSYVTSAKYGAYIFWLFLSFFVHLVITKLGYPLKANEKQYMSGHLHTAQTTPANLQRNAVVWCKIPWVYMKYTPVL